MFANRNKVIVAAALAAVVIGMCLSMVAAFNEVKKFSTPNEKQRIAAIGDTSVLPADQQRIFEATGDFEPLQAPGPGDWLAAHFEAGQTFRQFLDSSPNRLGGRRQKLYILPVGEFGPGAPSLSKLAGFARAYFGCPVELMQPVPVDEKITSRINRYSGRKQLLTTDLMNASLGRLPADAYALLTVTMTDLYPEPSWNFVFGQASLEQRVGVFSFARYDPAFYEEERTEDSDRLVLLRSMKVLTHEMAHMFGIPHCVFFNCNMNGSNNLEETDRTMISMCPIDLRKLHSTVGFDLKDRYEKLRDFYQAEGLEVERSWIDRRLEKLMNEAKK